MAHAPFPDGLDESHTASGPAHVRHLSLWSILILGALMAVALSGRLGGSRSEWRVARGADASLAVHSPQVMRNGLFFETRVRITATRPIEEPVLVVPLALWRDMTINSEFPEPKEQTQSGGALRFTYDALAAGETLELKFDGQVNPPLFRGTAGVIGLADGERTLVSMPVKTTVLP